MNTRDITLGRCFSEGWEVFARNAGLTILSYFLFNLISAALGATQLGSILGAFPLTGGLTILFLGLQKGLTAEIGTLFSGFSSVENWLRWLGVGWLLALYQFVVFLVAAFIGAIPVAGGIVILSCGGSVALGILLIVLGCLFALVASWYYCVRWIFVFFVAAEGGTALESIAASDRLTEGIRPRLFWISVVLGLFNIAGVLVCCIGFFFTGPVTQSVLSALYLDVKEMRSQQTQAVQPSP